ncbi:helix-turn-helix domain-containing protein [Streptomyces sp. GbtcB6]|uniref:helix-turn-helix domain-containing protein n=1 Tax=Streptomyces sp. GbtcB6 TaxID=2824751 RepID=UPI001C31124A|nr:helix-turn-helix transcriptional regulator [Streptomyces sp. GbtcB6]
MPALLQFNPAALRRVRADQQLTLRQLADQVGCVYTTIIKYERGRCIPSSPAMASLAAALGAPMETFFERVEVSE